MVVTTNLTSRMAKSRIGKILPISIDLRDFKFFPATDPSLLGDPKIKVGLDYDLEDPSYRIKWIFSSDSGLAKVVQAYRSVQEDFGVGNGNEVIASYEPLREMQRKVTSVIDATGIPSLMRAYSRQTRSSHSDLLFQDGESPATFGHAARENLMNAIDHGLKYEEGIVTFEFWGCENGAAHFVDTPWREGFELEKMTQERIDELRAKWRSEIESHGTPLSRGRGMWRYNSTHARVSAERIGDRLRVTTMYLFDDVSRNSREIHPAPAELRERPVSLQ